MSQLHLEKFKARPLSWSSISSFEYNKEQWARRYLDGIIDPPSPEMLFGKMIGEKLEKDPTYLPIVPRCCKMEHPFNVSLSGILLTGFADSFDNKIFKSGTENKTGVKKWDKKRVDSHGQITMYLLMNYITNKVKPEDVEFKLIWLPTQRKESGNFEVEISFREPIEENIKIFKTKRTMTDILKFASYIKDVYGKMLAYASEYEGSV